MKPGASPATEATDNRELPPASGLVHARAGLILFAFACFASEHLVHYPVALMALFGVAEALRAPRALVAPHGRTLLLLFALIWLPMLLAWSDAVDAQRSGKTVLLYLHLLPAAWFVVQSCRDLAVQRLVTLGAASLVCFVAFDAFIQLIWHSDLFGYPYEDGILKGVFHPKQRLGLFLAVFAPLTIDAVLRWCRLYPQLWLFLVPLALAIAMSLKRSAWLMLAVGLVVWMVLRWRQTPRLPSRRRLLQCALVALAVLAATSFSPSFERRVADTRGLFSADLATVDSASGYRLSLWRTGLDMFRAHWLNGVGPRGYRQAYVDHAAPDDFWVARNGHGQTHPHLQLLEIAAESGLVGVLGFGVCYAWLWWLLWQPTVGRNAPVWLLAAVVAWFPLNAHLAFYGSYWSTLAWLLIAIGLAAWRPASTST